MRKRMTVILALVVGVFLGYAARDLPISEYIASGGDGNEVASATATVSVSGQPAGVVGDATPPEPLPEVHPFPAADMYLDYVLPERALIQWKICAGDIRDNTGEDSLSSLAKRDALRNLFASLSQGPGPSFAPFIAELAAQADTIQIFLMPPDGQLPTLTFLLAATWPEVSYADLRKCLREPICAGLENGNPYGKPTGEFVVEGVSSNTGNVSYAVTEGMVWVCNSPIVLEQTLTMPPPPKPETDPPAKELLGTRSAGWGDRRIQSAGPGRVGRTGGISRFAETVGNRTNGCRLGRQTAEPCGVRQIRPSARVDQFLAES